MGYSHQAAKQAGQPTTLIGVKGLAFLFLDLPFEHVLKEEVKPTDEGFEGVEALPGQNGAAGTLSFSTSSLAPPLSGHFSLFCIASGLMSGYTSGIFIHGSVLHCF